MTKPNYGCLELVFEHYNIGTNYYWVSIKTDTATICFDLITSIKNTKAEVEQDYIAALNNNDAHNCLPELKSRLSEYYEYQ